MNETELEAMALQMAEAMNRTELDVDFIAWIDWRGTLGEYDEYRKAWRDIPAMHESIGSATARVPSPTNRGGTP